MKFHKGYIRKPIIVASNMYKDPICAEVGVSEGDHAEAMLYYLKPKELYLVDHWVNNDYGFNKTQNIFKDCNNVIYHREYSKKCAETFKDNYFDVVYIDADHCYEAVKLGLNCWYPKIKSGGMLCGHDANRSGVILAINEFAKEQKLEMFDDIRNF